jgi:hypothetical protein
MRYEKETQLIKVLEDEVIRFQRKLNNYKVKIAEMLLEDSYTSSTKEHAALKRAAMDLKQELHKVN